MAQDQPVKALIITLVHEPAAAAYSINRLKPEMLCFVLPESGKAVVESGIQFKVEQMPRRWDWIVLADPDEFAGCHRAISQSLPDLLQTWQVQPGELVVDLSGATPAMAAALAIAVLPWTSRIVSLIPARKGGEEEITLEGQRLSWIQTNPWDEAAAWSRREGSELFNRGEFFAAAKIFRAVEARVSGGGKPLYRALADAAEGYGWWERFHYRQAWDRLKGALKALEMASLWGGPPGLKTAVADIKANVGFLERLVLDPAEVKELLVADLLAHAARRLRVARDPEGAMVTLLRALEACAQRRLFMNYRIKSWDVRPESLPPVLQETCRTCYLDDVDGKYKLPLQAQFRALAGLGDQMGQLFLRTWPTMKPLLDAASHAVLGHGAEPIKAERAQQLYEVTVKLSGVAESSLPKFPSLNL
ncbi:MAG: TIGR02710 family CRISPR-associated CARF protein [Nitrospira sp.]|nr:TIGR02710 family CRISPR-associated CARF protein [Nitrospira sp.]MCP9463904.1 TIGR02710 family CRISPR-associated CARF protein [Nitrospira sp.]